MEFECKLSTAEMREAFRMNQSKIFWIRPLRNKLHLFLIVVALALGAMLDIVEHQGSIFANFCMLFGPEVLVLGVFWWRIWRKVDRMTAQVNAATARIRLDATGIATFRRDGSTTSMPWSHYNRWKEGKLVFTATGGKAFRTIPKGGMNEMQVAEVRGILQTQMRVQ